MPINAPWKRNLRKIPEPIERKLAKLTGKDVIVAAVKKIPEHDIADGMYSHLLMKMGASGPEFAEQVTPDPRVGRWSRTNVEGWEVVRKDLPMYQKTFAVESPNWGDASTYGTHTS